MIERSFRQRLPRPAVVRPGRDPAWGGLGREVLDIGEVLTALDRHRLGQVPFAARSAVLVPLFADEGAAKVLCIRRAAHLARDPSHIAFPGGRIEAGESPLDAALRETTEELGIEPAAVEVLGALPVAERASDGQRVAPFVGLLAARPALHPNPAEVEAVLELPLSGLLREGVAWEEDWSPEPGRQRTVRFFADHELLGDDVIWGLTARILWGLLEWCTGVAGGTADPQLSPPLD